MTGALSSFAEARRNGNTFLTDDWRALVAHPEVDVVVESTGDPIAAVEHALEAFRNGKSVVMVTVEADAFCGPLLARRAAEAGVIYSLAYGDQPAISIQLHPEFEPAYAKALIENRRGSRYTDAQADAAIASYDAPDDRSRVGGWIQRFLRTATVAAD